MMEIMILYVRICELPLRNFNTKRVNLLLALVKITYQADGINASVLEYRIYGMFADVHFYNCHTV